MLASLSETALNISRVGGLEEQRSDLHTTLHVLS